MKAVTDFFKIGMPGMGKRSCTEPWPLFFWFAAFFLMFYSLGYCSFRGSEGRWAEIAREMMLSGDYFHPAINGVPYFDKPLLTYWVIIAAAWLTGSLNEFSARLPSAVAGLVTLWATVSLGEKLFSRRAGYMAAWILLTSYGILFWSRTACADVENIMFILLAVLWYRHRRERPGFVSYAVFYLICATGAHFKGLPAAVLPGLICFPDILRGSRWRKYVSWSHVAAICLGITLYLAPFMYAAFTAAHYGENGLYLVFRENILRFFNAFDHREPPYVYLYYVPMLFLPWSPLLLFSMADAVRGYRKLDHAGQWLLEASGIIFLIYTLSDSRRSYYIMPIMPFCALITGNFLTGAGRASWVRIGLEIQFYLLVLIAAVESSAPLIIPIITRYTGIIPPEGLTVSMSVTGIAMLAVMVLLLRTGICMPDKDRVGRLVAAVTAASIIMCGGFFCWQQHVLERYRSHKAFLSQVRQVLADMPEAHVALNKNNAAIIFYLGYKKPLKILKTREEVAEFLAMDGLRFLIIQRRALSRAFSVLPAEMAEHPLISSRLYPGTERTKMQLLAWKITRPVKAGNAPGRGP